MAKSSDKDAQQAEAGDKGGKRDAKRRAANVHSPSSRVNVAFPFSQIKLEEPSKELSELAAIVMDLVDSMAEWIPEERLGELRERARAVHEGLR